MTNSNIYSRLGAESVSEALANTPVALLVGPRGSGKTTLARQFISSNRQYISLDNEESLEAALYDPAGFVRGMDSVIIDEVQRAPQLLLAIRQAVEDEPRPGRFLLTSSVDISRTQHIPEDLASRMEVILLLPLSRAEMDGQRPAFLSAALSGELVEPPFSMIGSELIQNVVAGGYPEMLRRREPGRKAWVRNFVKKLAQRDAREIAQIEKLNQLPRLLEALAAHSGQLTNFSQIGCGLEMDDKTTQKYTAILERLFLVHRVSAWHSSRLSRLVKTPKLHFVDSGIHAAMLGLSSDKVAGNRLAFGALLGTFVLAEIVKQATWSDQTCTVTHYRDKDQNQVDFLVEDEGGAMAGICVKPAATVYAADFKGLCKVQDSCCDDLKLGVVLYDGTRTVVFGDRLFAAPISCLWGNKPIEQLKSAK